MLERCIVCRFGTAFNGDHLSSPLFLKLSHYQSGLVVGQFENLAWFSHFAVAPVLNMTLRQ
jgi:hypothetical protein